MPIPPAWWTRRAKSAPRRNGRWTRFAPNSAAKPWVPDAASRNRASELGSNLAHEVPMPIIDSRLKELGITLFAPPKPVAAYVPYTISGNLVFVSGQVPFQGGAL